MDSATDFEDLEPGVVVRRAAAFLGWLLGFLAMMALVGIIPTIFVFVIAYMRVENRERWTLAVAVAAGLCLFVYGLFDVALAIPWPPTLLGRLVPVLGVIPSV